jgi:hypothetical protein
MEEIDIEKLVPRKWKKIEKRKNEFKNGQCEMVRRLLDCTLQIKECAENKQDQTLFNRH